MLTHGLAEGQHFLDGNKRVALAATVGFLAINGYTLALDDGVYADWILELGEHTLDVPTLADRIRGCLREI